jgi:hypothetical protein
VSVFDAMETVMKERLGYMILRYLLDIFIEKDIVIEDGVVLESHHILEVTTSTLTCLYKFRQTVSVALQETMQGVSLIQFGLQFHNGLGLVLDCDFQVLLRDFQRLHSRQQTRNDGNKIIFITVGGRGFRIGTRGDRVTQGPVLLMVIVVVGGTVGTVRRYN